MFKHRCPHPYHQEKIRFVLEKAYPIVIVALLVVAFIAGRHSVGELLILSEENEKLQQKIETLDKVNKDLLKQQHFIDSGKKVDQLAKQDARRMLTDLHDELSDLKEQLRFYQQITSPESVVKGLYIHSFTVIKDVDSGRFNYQLTLAQVSDKRSVIKGKATFVIAGQQNDKPVRLEMKAVTIEQKEAAAFSFRYYQLLSGSMALPTGFVPEYVEVNVRPSSKSIKELHKKWQWEDVMEGVTAQ
jgi:cell division protein FtsB